MKLFPSSTSISPSVSSAAAPVSSGLSASQAIMEPVEKRELFSVVTPKLVEVPISSAAKSADATLAKARTFDLQVTVPSGERWASGDLRLNLTRGTLYNPTDGANTPESNAWALEPELQFDSFVSTSDFGTPVVLGRSTFPTNPGGAAIFNSKTMDVAWGDLGSTKTGTFTIARFTVSGDAQGVLYGRVGGVNLDPVTFSSGVPLYAGGASITGYVWNDQDSDGGKNGGETNLAGVQLYIDANGNRRLDSNERSVRTHPNGVYIFSGLAAGTYRVRVNPPTGYRVTSPTRLANAYNVTIIDGANAPGKRFGLTQKALLSGMVYNDRNGDRHQQSNELGLAHFTVYIDKNNNSILDAGEESRVTGSDGFWEFHDLEPGLYTVRIAPSRFYRRTTQSGFDTLLASGGVRTTGMLFGERRIA